MVVSVNNDIEIAKGKRLTIFGTLNMGKNTSIKVRAGAELVVDGGIITNQCGLTWKGIDVHGASNQPQIVPFPSSPQGKVVLKNGAIIEHANDAITTLDFQSPNSAGGVIEAENAIFRNNKRDIEFYKYNRHNLSYFNFVDFKVDTNYRFPTIKPRITMWGIKGLEFTACNFNTQHPNFLYQDDGSIQAQNVLRFFYNQSYEVPLILPDSTAPQRLAAPQHLPSLADVVEVKVYPNPARDFVTFEYQIGEIETEASIVVMDLSGRTIKVFSLSDPEGQVLWDTREVSQGQYLFVLKNQKGVIKSGQVSIIK